MSRRLLSLLTFLLAASAALAHDGGFGHSRRTLFLAAEPGQIILEYRIAANRDEALIEMTQMDRDHDGKVSAEERDRFFAARGKELAENLHLRTADGERVPLKFTGYELKHPLSQVFRFVAATKAENLLLDDRNFPHKPGMIRLHAGQGLAVEPARTVDLNHADKLSLKITRK